ncbi:hypothetical protein BLA24_28075 [Streptomyces cinnamoneus]|uniref:Amidase domain-containing protein n=1 Tax=Streptomyces cinnamoneus TaxID=53446 RepID=A0A2G1XCE0_STRCJ|nr:hypothetical protein [Streptomyces cinnamoneus]PHQ48917.1 hypothetical protein BLA24_28075 [Streptomyces cinnamoneus]
MVSYNDLHSCHVDQWKKAADDWIALSRRSSTAADDVREQGKKPLDDHWADATGKKASKRLHDLADRLEAGGDIIKGVAMIIDGLASSMEWSQRTLFHAAELAAEYGLHIQDGRAVGAYSGAAPVGPNIPQNVRDDYKKEQGHISEVNDLIDEALRQASQADKKASAELDKLATKINVSDTNVAHNYIETETAHLEIDMIRGSIPVGKDPHLVRAWWDGLTPEQHKALMLADPVTIADLTGLPDDVGRRSGAATARSTASRWSATRWTTGTARRPQVREQLCQLRLVRSRSRRHAEEVRHLVGPRGDNTWGRESGIGIDWWDQRAYHSRSWASAKYLRNFLTDNGGEEVPRSQARPGDLIFYEQVAEDPGKGGEPQGETYHAAVVTRSRLTVTSN